MSLRHILLLLLIAPAIACAQPNAQPIRVMTWNLLSVGSDLDPERRDAIRSVVREVAPDIFVAQEILTDGGATALDTITGADGRNLVPAPFTGDSLRGSLLYYDSARLELLGSWPLTTSTAPAGIYTLHVRDTRDTLQVVVALLSEGDDAEARARRSAETTLLRDSIDRLPATYYHLLAGSLNIGATTESAWSALVEVDPDLGGEVHDPLKLEGSWRHDPDRAVHATSSTRTRSFGGGDTLGLVARTDFLLISRNLLPLYLEGSYEAYGNDGLHYADSINRLPNDSIPDSIATALHAASDHLPVVAVFEFGGVGVTDVPWRGARGPRLDLRFDPVSRRISFDTEGRGLTFTLSDTRGAEMLRLSGPTSGPWSRSVDLGDLPSGLYLWSVSGAEGAKTGTIPLVR